MGRNGNGGRLAGRIAIVTGAASGFGREIARVYAHEGASVVVADVQEEAGHKACAELASMGAHSHFQRCDISREDSVMALLEATMTRYGRVDVVVNNAGVVHPNGPALEVSPEHFDRVFSVNVRGLFWMARAAIPRLLESQGCMVNIASTTGVRPGPGITWYSASKAAVINATKGLALEFAPRGVRVNCICPMIGDTPMLAQAMGQVTPENIERYRARVPLGRFTQPADVANAALFLAEPAASFLTGVCLDVDGGRNI